MRIWARARRSPRPERAAVNWIHKGTLICLTGVALVLLASQTIALGPLGTNIVFANVMMVAAGASALGLGYFLPRSSPVKNAESRGNSRVLAGLK